MTHITRSEAKRKMLEVAKTMVKGEVDTTWPCPLRAVFGTDEWVEGFVDLWPDLDTAKIFGPADNFRKSGEEYFRSKCIAAIKRLPR